MRMKIKMVFDKIYNFFSSTDIVLDLVFHIVLHMELGVIHLYEQPCYQVFERL